MARVAGPHVMFAISPYWFSSFSFFFKAQRLATARHGVSSAAYLHCQRWRVVEKHHCGPAALGIGTGIG